MLFRGFDPTCNPYTVDGLDVKIPTVLLNTAEPGTRILAVLKEPFIVTFPATEKFPPTKEFEVTVEVPTT